MKLSKLPMLDARAETLEKCVYCPKLCRATCPVSNAQPSETLTPWGKMSAAYFLARGDVPLEASHAESAWACTGCHACRDRCDHRNDVAEVLSETRAALFERGLAPEAAVRAVAKAREHEDAAGETTALADDSVALLVGCAYERAAPEVVEQALRVTKALTGTNAQLVKSCCGAPYRMAGDRVGFERATSRLAREVAAARTVVVVDAGCARTLLHDVPAGNATVPKVRLLVDLAEQRLDLFQPQSDASPVRYHDPCQLGRGLGRYEAPRRLLARITGSPVREFERARAQADCSGGGGLLPLSYPEASRQAAESRLAEHNRLGGGPLVTACAGSLRRLRSTGAEVVDLVSWLDRGLERE